MSTIQRAILQQPSTVHFVIKNTIVVLSCICLPYRTKRERLHVASSKIFLRKFGHGYCFLMTLEKERQFLPPNPSTLFSSSPHPSTDMRMRRRTCPTRSRSRTSSSARVNRDLIELPLSSTAIRMDRFHPRTTYAPNTWTLNGSCDGQFRLWYGRPTTLSWNGPNPSTSTASIVSRSFPHLSKSLRLSFETFLRTVPSQEGPSLGPRSFRFRTSFYR